MGNLSEILGDSWSPPQEKIYDSPEVQFINEIVSFGLTAPERLIIDSTLHRFTTDNKQSKKTGWYVAFLLPIPVIVFGCWKADIKQTKRAETGKKYTPVQEMKLLSQMSEAKKLHDQEREHTQEVAAEQVTNDWQMFTPASPDHAYLKRKGIKPHGAKIDGCGRLTVPLFSEDGDLSSLQYIDPNGNKLYHKGAATGAKFWLLGEIKQTLYIAEGFATAATIRECTNEAVCVAYSASNLPLVAGIMRAKYGASQDIVVVADNDASGVGQKYADQASAKHGVRVVMPPTPGDANDYVQEGNDLFILLNPPQEEWLINADKFCLKPEPIKWLVKNWLPERSLIMVHGPSGGGKTFAVLDWVMHMAGGLPTWAGQKVKSSTVVYLAGEGHQGLKGRVAAWKQKKQVNKLNMWLSKSGCDLNTPAGYQKVVSQIRLLENKPDLIVVDTLHRFLLGDENSSQDAKTMLDACAALMSEFGCSVLLVHHTGVSEEAQHRARGSSAWRGALDIEVSIVPSKDGRPLEIIQRKQKDGELAEPLYGRIESVPISGWFDEDGDAVTSATLELVATPDKPATQADKKLNEHKKLFEDAYLDSGERLEGQLYISKSALKEYINIKLFNGDGGKNATNMVNPGQKNKFINRLIESNTVREHLEGFVIIDQKMIDIVELLKG